MRDDNRIAVAPAGLIVREFEPKNLESAQAALQTFVTANENFYVRNHFPEPDVLAESWQLEIAGAVERPFAIGYEELKAMPTRSHVSLMECAGNGRVFLTPREPGTQWQSGAVGNAEWTGVPLAAILERAGVRPGAVDVILEGADRGEILDEPQSPGPIHFTHSIPLTKALGEDVLLAFRMNGAALPRAHGFPVRAVVPGWYGMASVKWLSRIRVSETPFHGYFQSLHYSRWERLAETPTLVPVTEMRVKTTILAPALHEVIAADAPYTMRGVAWGGEIPIVQVEISTDGGQQWTQAKLTGPSLRYAWRMWEYEWTPEAGSYAVMSRGTDASGNRQPLERERDLRSYEITHVIPIAVVAR